MSPDILRRKLENALAHRDIGRSSALITGGHGITLATVLALLDERDSLIDAAREAVVLMEWAQAQAETPDDHEMVARLDDALDRAGVTS